MSDNLHDASLDAFAVPGWRLLVIAGRDALAFAQAQFMNDVASLSDGQWQWNGWLTSKGRVIALFALLRLGPDTLWLVLPDADPAKISAQLQNYVFRSKVSLSVRNDLHASGFFSMPSQVAGSTFHHAGAGIELDLGGDGGPRTLRLDQIPSPDNPISESAWRAQDLLHGLPHLDATQAEHWTPQQLSLDRLRAFSVKKGCYPGQEIVARTHYLGQVKRGLALLETTGEGISTVATGTDVHAAGLSIGNVVCTSGALVLAVMPLDVPTTELTADGMTMQPRTLRNGLAR